MRNPRIAVCTESRNKWARLIWYAWTDACFHLRSITFLFMWSSLFFIICLYAPNDVTTTPTSNISIEIKCVLLLAIVKFHHNFTFIAIDNTFSYSVTTDNSRWQAQVTYLISDTHLKLTTCLLGKNRVTFPAFVGTLKTIVFVKNKVETVWAIFDFLQSNKEANKRTIFCPDEGGGCEKNKGDWSMAFVRACVCSGLLAALMLFSCCHLCVCVNEVGPFFFVCPIVFLSLVVNALFGVVFRWWLSIGGGS